MPDVDVALVSPVVALREGLPVREHVAFLHIWTLPEAVVVQPGRPVVHVARAELPVGCSERREEKRKKERISDGFVSVTCVFARFATAGLCVLMWRWR